MLLLDITPINSIKKILHSLDQDWVSTPKAEMSSYKDEP